MRQFFILRAVVCQYRSCSSRARRSKLNLAKEGDGPDVSSAMPRQLLGASDSRSRSTDESYQHVRRCTLSSNESTLAKQQAESTMDSTEQKTAEISREITVVLGGGEIRKTPKTVSKKKIDPRGPCGPLCAQKGRVRDLRLVRDSV